MLPTKKTEPVFSLSNLNALIYGPSKIGKSTWCSEADGALFLATEPGHKALSVFKVDVESWRDMLRASAEVAKGEHKFKTIIIDTIDNLYDMCADYVNAQNNVKHENDLAFGKGSSLVMKEFKRVINKLSVLPYGLIMVSHSKEGVIRSKITGESTRIRPSLPPKVAEYIGGLVDLILYCDIESRGFDNGKPVYRRVIRTKGTDLYEAGDRTGRLPETLALDYSAFCAAMESGAEQQKALPDWFVKALKLANLSIGDAEAEAERSFGKTLSEMDRDELILVGKQLTQQGEE